MLQTFGIVCECICQISPTSGVLSSSFYAIQMDTATTSKYTQGRKLALFTMKKNLGASSNVVVRLARTIPSNCGHKLFFDNYYTSIPLIIYLKKRSIHSCGTVRRNRVQNCPLSEEKAIAKKERGYSAEYVAATKYGTSFNVVLWKDNRCVSLMSTFLRSSDRSPGQSSVSSKKKWFIPV